MSNNLGYAPDVVEAAKIVETYVAGLDHEVVQRTGVLAAGDRRDELLADAAFSGILIAVCRLVMKLRDPCRHTAGQIVRLLIELWQDCDFERIREIVGIICAESKENSPFLHDMSQELQRKMDDYTNKVIYGIKCSTGKDEDHLPDGLIRSRMHYNGFLARYQNHELSPAVSVVINRKCISCESVAPDKTKEEGSWVRISNVKITRDHDRVAELDNTERLESSSEITADEHEEDLGALYWERMTRVFPCRDDLRGPIRAVRPAGRYTIN